MTFEEALLFWLAVPIVVVLWAGFLVLLLCLGRAVARLLRL